MNIQSLKKNTGMIRFIITLIVGALNLNPVIAQVRNDNTDTPLYASGILTLPSVDTLTSGNVLQGLYRNVLLHYDADIDAFRLVRAETFPVSDDLVKDVELLMTESQPIQVFLHVSGKFGIACGNIPAINYRQSSHVDRPQYRSEFEVTIRSLKNGTELPCITDEKIYTYNFPIHAYGLQSGLYAYTVNGIHTGTFELKTDNVVSTDTLRGLKKK
ncbi:MAG: hypothetical protein E6Q62_06255 [Nitrosomonas sp.]|nr:MAG: hypothetical protein E6Q62_06255 [Nitrosomonas sp.]